MKRIISVLLIINLTALLACMVIVTNKYLHTPPNKIDIRINTK